MRDILYAITPDLPILSFDVARTLHCGNVTVNIQEPQYKFVRQETRVREVPTPLNAGKRRSCTEQATCDQEDVDADMILLGDHLESQGSGV